ncbi:hypothetical protein ACO0K0_07325 [Undibacterium sp. SXout11W]|uniref:hypothetical protein n=1 Tax=Undibacterium sp. SXout11W TaxID=3413050 RepID=UPI003BF05D4F
MRKRRWKSVRATCLSEAMELCLEYANEQRRPIKVLADLMGVEVKTLYRWLSDTSMPLNRIRQFETFCGATFLSEYLCLAHGDKVVVAIPSGKKADVTDLAALQGNFAEAITLLARFYQHGEDLEETLAALTETLSQLAYQRGNVLKVGQPELELFGVQQ